MENPMSPPWLRSVEGAPQESTPVRATSERSPLVRSILDVLDKEADKDNVVELSTMLDEWRDITTSKNDGNPLIAHDRIRTFASQLREMHPEQVMDKVILFHLLSGSTLRDADKDSYVIDIPTEDPSGQGIIESEIRALSSSV